MPTQEERLDTVEFNLRQFKTETIKAYTDMAYEMTIERLAKLDKRFEHVETRLDAMDVHLESMDTRLDRVETILTQILARLPGNT